MRRVDKSRSILAAAALALLTSHPALAEHPAPNGHPRPVDADCEHFWPNETEGVTLEPVRIPTGPDSDGAPASVHGCLAYPSEVEPEEIDTLVITVHGNGHTVQNAWGHHLVEIASHGVAAIGVNFRDNFGFPTMQGAEDTIAATLVALDRFPGVERTILVGVSMGGAISGTAITQAARFNDGAGLYDHWVCLECVSNVVETWAEAKAAGNSAMAGIERDAGGTPVEVPEAYRERSPVMNAARMSELGLESVVLVHAAFDGLVPYWQSRSMWAALGAAGVPTEFTTVGRGSGDFGDSNPFDLGGRGDLNDDTVGLAGHASEGDRNHPVVRTGLERLFGLIAGEAVDPSVDAVVDEP